MSRYCHSTDEVKKTKKILSKHKQFEVKTPKAVGYVTVKNWRKYNYYNEVDIIFDGQIFVNYTKKLQWIDASVLKTKNVSLIKCNKIIRRLLWKEVNNFLYYFSISFQPGQLVIKKVKWI